MNALAILHLKFDAVLNAMPKGPIKQQCDALKTSLHDRSPKMKEVYDDIPAFYSESIAPAMEEDVDSELAQWLNGYIKQVESLFGIISICRHLSRFS